MVDSNYVELTKSIKNGHESAYDSLFREFYTPLVLFSVSLTNDKDISENIVQSIFCNIWESRKKLSKINNIKSYLYTSVRNKSLTHLRDIEKIDFKADFPEKEDKDITNSILEGEIYTELYSAVNKLPLMCKNVFLLKLEGLKNEEIAENIGISKETVRSHLKKGYSVIKKDLEEIYYLLPILFLKKD